MPQDTPYYDKLIYLAFDSTSKKAEDFGYWLYQRLHYFGLPAWCRINQRVGGSGFLEHSIAAADPVILILSNSFDSKWAIDSVFDEATSTGKRIVVVVFEEVEIPNKMIEFKRYDFRINREQALRELFSDLSDTAYPSVSYPYGSPKENLEYARSHEADYIRNPCYMSIFAQYYAENEKIEAISDMVQLGIFEGVILAALEADRNDRVRAHAALALAQTRNWDYILPLRMAVRKDMSTEVKLYAQAALALMENTEIVDHLVSDISSIVAQEKESIGNHKSDLQSPSAFSVFISYARADSEAFAIELHDRLEALGYNAWIDTKLEPGTPVWRTEIQNAIKHSQFFVTLVSPASIESEWVEREISYAEEHDKTIIPIMALPTNRPLSLVTHQGLRGNPFYSEDPDRVITLLTEYIKSKQQE